MSAEARDSAFVEAGAADERHAMAFRITVAAAGGERRLTADNGAVRQDRAVSFFRLRDGKIAYLREYWPEPYAAPDWRAQWVEMM